MTRHKKGDLIATIDCETDPFKYGRKPVPFIWGFYDGRDYQQFYNTHQLVERLKSFPGIVYAHNGGKFDYHFILDSIASGTKLLAINGRVSKVKLGKCELRDSLNILPFPLKMMQKDEFDYTKLEKDVRHLHKEEIEKYLKSDCVHLYRFVRRFIDDYGLHLTQASAAFNIWHEMSGMDKPIMRGKRGLDYYEKFAPFYYGGRVTPFKVGVFKGDFEMIDINSAYPAAMTTNHPYGRKFNETTRPPDSLLHLTMMTVRGESFGAFPLRAENGNKLDFPHTKGEFHITGHEFKVGLETGTFRCDKIVKAYVAQDTINFTPYVERFHKMKQAAGISKDKAARLFAKIFLNALYGKYCANPSDYTEDYLYDKNLEIGELEGLKEAMFEPGIFLGGNRIWSRKTPEENQQFYNVVTGASITGFVRAFLWESIRKVDTPYYCDTDSIICKGLGSLTLGDKLGEWSTEMKGQKLAIAGKKMYCLWDGEKAKLASKGARLEPNEILRIARGETIEYKQEAPTYSLSRGVNFLSRKIKKTA